MKPPTLPKVFYHACPKRHLASIQAIGLQARDSSRQGQKFGIYLAKSREIGLHDSISGFGTDNDNDPWVLLHIRTGNLDPSRFVSDDQEANDYWDEYKRFGYSSETHRIEDIPWPISLGYCGNVCYEADIPPSEILGFETIGPNDHKVNGLLLTANL